MDSVADRAAEPIEKKASGSKEFKGHTSRDWERIAYLMHLSRTMDETEEREGFVKYQFSAKGHELAQILLSQKLTYPFDAASGYYRSRPFALGSGLTPKEGFEAGLATSGGISDGRDVGVVFNLPKRDFATIIPMAGDVGSQYTPAVGWAQAIRYRVETLGEDHLDGSIAVAMGGDGSVAANGFWAAITMATTLNLPILFLIEDNGFGISVRSDLQTPGRNIAANLNSFQNLEIWDGDGINPGEAASLVDRAVAYVRSGKGPGLLRLTCQRLSGHSGHDNQAYKTSDERKQDETRDPLPALKNYLVPDTISAATWDALAEEAESDVRQALEAAFASPQPVVGEITNQVWYNPADPAEIGGLEAEEIYLPKGSEAPTPNGSRVNMIDAIRMTLDSELDLNERLTAFGEDVGFKGGVHAATLGLQKKYGESRVFDTSLSEEGIIGRAVGMALAGLKPVPEIQFRKYADPATEQLNNCGTVRWRTKNRFAAPIVVRIPGGYRKIGDPWHSVTSEVTFVHQPGWQVAVPSNAEDAVGLLRSALRGHDPVIFFEHRAMLDAAWARRHYPGDDFVIPFGQGKRITQGEDLTVVTWGAMVELCESAAKQLSRDGHQVEIIDLRTLMPWDKEMVLDSIQKTSKCLIVHEDIGRGGFGAEIAATITDEGFMDLDGPVRRVTAPGVPVPYSPALMKGVVPTVEKIQAAILELITF
ncbi:MAG: transketolase C-terminal domain-containing protein [Chloroflexota bacterium]